MARWIAITVDAPKGLDELLGSFLLDEGATGLQTQDDPQRTNLTAYFDRRTELARLIHYSFSLLASKRDDQLILSQHTVEEEDWAENWKLHFTPIQIGERFLIHPPWTAPPQDPLTIAIEIDPGMAFGTGQHATTRGCLLMIERHVAAPRMNTALDLGTGSGILAIALAKLGLTILAVDNDPIALQNALQNALANRVTLSVAEAIESSNRRFDVIVANLYSNLLMELAGEICARMNSAGVFICSGFVSTDAQVVQHAFERCRIAVEDRIDDAGWTTLMFRSQA